MKRNENEVKISIIMPCYNSQDYIQKTLDSVFNQTFKDFELICVNDGSKDNTLKILEENAKVHPNMKVVTKKNEGGKGTSIYGIKYICGKYVCIVDNDDYLSNDYLEELYKCITKDNADIAVCGFQREDFVTNKVYSREMINRNGTFNLSEDYGLLLEINTSLWNKMFKREIVDSLLDFRLDALGFGDMTLMAFMYNKINKVSFTNQILYYYQVREGSDINSMKSSVIDSIYDNLIRIREFYSVNNKKMCDIMDAYAFLHLGISLMYRIYRTKDEKFNSILKNNTKILNTNFSSWKKNKYYNLRYVITHKGRNLKLHISYLFYRIHLFKLFISLYDFFTSKMKFDIKW